MNLCCSLLALEQSGLQLRSTPHRASKRANMPSVNLQQSIEQGRWEMSTKRWNNLPKTFRKQLNSLFTHLVADSTLSSTAHVHVNYCGQRFPSYTERHSPLTCFYLGCWKILCGHRHLVCRMLWPFSAQDLHHLHRPCQQGLQQSCVCRVFMHFK